MSQTTQPTPITHKVRRKALGSKGAAGHLFQSQFRRVRRPDPRNIRLGKPDSRLTAFAGLVPFGSYLREIGVDADLRRLFGHLKTGKFVVYPMATQMRLIVDANAVGEKRVFGLENLAADPLFTHLAGGTVSSIDTVYRDLARFKPYDIVKLESFMARHGLWKKSLQGRGDVHIDIDTSVEPLFGSQEGALPGPNPRYHGRPSYHPIFAAVAETQTCVGASLRPGDTAFGKDDVPFVERVIDRVQAVVNPSQSLRVRIDAAGDCTPVMRAMDAKNVTFLCKAKLNEDMRTALFETTQWRTVEHDESGRPVRQVADVDFLRKEWKKAGCSFRVCAVREKDPNSGRQVYLWPDLDYCVKAYVTNDWETDADYLAHEYEDRAEVEPLIGEWKYAMGIGAVPTDDFDSNHVMLLLKLLSYNLMRRFARRHVPELSCWRMPWLRNALLCVPGRLVRSGRGTHLRLPPRSLLMRFLN